jgi:hypothetical protein
LCAVLWLGLSAFGCGGGSTGPAVTPPTAEEKKENQAMHDEKAKEAGVPANAPADPGAAK